MVTSIARQAVIIKSQDSTSGVLGGYEACYCLGLIAKMLQLPENDGYTQLEEWCESIMSVADGYTSEDKQIMEVIRMMRAYEPTGEVDDQMRELYRMGIQESRMWQL